MRRDTVNYVAVGSFVLLVMAALGATLFYLTGHSGPVDHYTVHYRNVAGLKYGTPVYFEGYGVGQIESVTPEHLDDGVRYRVLLGIQRNWPIPKDSVAAVVSSGLLSDVSIAIVEGHEHERLKPGAEILGQEGTDIFTAFNELAMEIRSLTQNSIRPLVKQLNDTLGNGAGPIVADVRQLLDKLNKSADSLNLVLGTENREQLSQTLAHMNATTANAQQLTTELIQTRKQVDQMLTQANGILAENRPDAQQAVRELRISLQAISGRIDNIMQQLEGTSRNMQEFSREIRNNPGRLLSGKTPDDVLEKDK